MWGSMRKEGALKSRTGFWPKGWAGLLMLSQTIRLSVFGLPSVANFSITFCRLLRLFLSQLASKAAITVTAISNAIDDGSLMAIHPICKQLRFLLSKFAKLICGRVYIWVNIYGNNIFVTNFGASQNLISIWIPFGNLCKRKRFTCHD